MQISKKGILHLYLCAIKIISIKENRFIFFLSHKEMRDTEQHKSGLHGKSE